ncbi:MAG: di-heme enzyme [Sandaracinaceae bacterium]|nr:di-heme enzyme [Sandaracinaceae bacterium]MBK7150666.1 di-heme enzyme [Sandaracinaceae bacterium]MBP7683403.1 di-heme enzyme [Deltaproteobacteria bacterium]
MTRTRTSARTILSALLLVTACSGDGTPGEFRFDLPAGFPEPRVPVDNPMSDAKVELGRRLFYDARLSENETQRCATCHLQALAFTDRRATSVGSTGQRTARGAMSLANVAYGSTFNWANSELVRLEEQARIPLFGESPVELGLGGLENLLLARLAADDVYPGMFTEAFPGEADPVSVENVLRALSAFQRTLISGSSPYDQHSAGDTGAMSPAALRGRDLFFGERLECFHCHGGFNFSNSVDHAGNQFDQALFANNGLYNVDGAGGYPAGNTGLFAMTNDRLDMGRFKPPSLRNIALTAPYMHDGSLETLDDVLDHYARGGTLTTEGPNVGDGSTSPLKSGFVAGFTLTLAERADVIAFLEALTDQEFVTDPRFSDPFLE